MKVRFKWGWMGLCAGCLLSHGSLSAKELSPREIYEQASPAVVMVMGHADSGKSGSAGTGSIIQADGLVLTNAHVVIEERTGRPYPRLSIFLRPPRVTGDSRIDLSRMVRARVLSYSNALDLALLKLDSPPAPLPVVAFSGSSQGRIGDRVVAMGHPEQGGLWTLTTGVISAEMDNFNGIKGKHVFQTETGLNRGNSGGPLLDNEGRMIAVNTAIARVAADGLPITSISFSLKSSVAAQWLREQGVNRQQPLEASFTRPPSMTNAASDLPSNATSEASVPQTKPAPQTKAPSTPPAKAEPPPARPYDLDALINDRAKAEADLEGMISEMRGRMKGR